MSKWVRVQEKSPVHASSQRGLNCRNYHYQLESHPEVGSLWFSEFGHFFPELCVLFKDRTAALRFYNRVVVPALKVKPRTKPEEMPLGLAFGNLSPMCVGKSVSQEGFKTLLTAFENDLGEFSPGMKSVVNSEIIPLVDKWKPTEIFGSWKRSANLDLRTINSGLRRIEFVCEGENLLSAISIIGEVNKCTMVKLQGESAASVKEFCVRVNANPKFRKKLYVGSNDSQIELRIKHTFPDDEYNNFPNPMNVDYFINFLKEFKDELKISNEMLEDLSQTLSTIQRDMQDKLMESLNVAKD